MTLLNRYTFFTLLSVVLLLIMGFVLNHMVYQSLLHKLERDLEKEAQRIDRSLSKMLDEIQTLMIYAGKKIVQEKIREPKEIWETLHDILGKRQARQQPWNWPHIGWTTDQNILSINTNYGILAEPKDLSFRQYAQAARREPWKLHFDPPDFATLANNWAINSGMGLIDEQGQFLGMLVAGFDIAGMTKELKENVANAAIRFKIYDRKANLMLSSSGQKKLASMVYPLEMKNFPFTVVTLIEKKTLHKEWIRVLKPHFIELSLVAAIYLTLLLFFWKRFQKKNRELEATKKQLEFAFSLARASDAAKEEFLQRINYEAFFPLRAITERITLLIANLKEEIDTHLTLERQVELFNEILTQAGDFKDLIHNSLTLTPVDLKNLMEQCITILSKSLFEKSIELKFEASAERPPFSCDEVKMKQIFVGLLSRAIQLSFVGSKIKVTLSHVKEPAQLQVVFEDEGLTLPDDLLNRLEDKFEFSHEADLDIKVPVIERLVNMHQGVLRKESKPGKGSTITLLLPMHNKECKNKILPLGAH